MRNIFLQTQFQLLVEGYEEEVCMYVTTWKSIFEKGKSRIFLFQLYYDVYYVLFFFQ